LEFPQSLGQQVHQVVIGYEQPVAALLNIRIQLVQPFAELIKLPLRGSPLPFA